eukprot:CAMPEP_0197883002 /NCGR_PEP_ID=MMETSP1439-20131203/9976_1 /TAXON_ID=66791 /ORGANISM="Gonyaulax spinifera, Strain CCMP409" /LENGTH=81 /DNA_ID=CAMNT_0043502697 /DNA_START=237 /DNA_END=482 /DNA_ORIENTATION=-
MNLTHMRALVDKDTCSSLPPEVFTTWGTVRSIVTQLTPAPPNRSLGATSPLQAAQIGRPCSMKADQAGGDPADGRCALSLL